MPLSIVSVSNATVNCERETIEKNVDGNLIHLLRILTAQHRRALYLWGCGGTSLRMPIAHQMLLVASLCPFVASFFAYLFIHSFWVEEFIERCAHNQPRFYAFLNFLATKYFIRNQIEQICDQLNPSILMAL